jgi:hypothetical protein
MNEDWSHFNALLTVLVVLYACVFVSVLIDLFFGIRRAKRLKIVRTSFGYDYVLMFKIIILQRYYNLSDEQLVSESYAQRGLRVKPAMTDRSLHCLLSNIKKKC